MPSELSCPYCNSPTAVPVGAHPGQRIPCPRCGELFPYRAPADAEAFTATPPPVAAPPPPVPVKRFSNKGVVLVILSVMIVMALLGLLYALKTEALRRSYDIHLPKTKAISIPLDVVFPLGLYILVLIAAWFRGWNRRDPTTATAAPPRRFAGLFLLSAAVLVLIEFGIIVYHARSVRIGEEESPPVRSVQPKELLALGYLPKDTDVIIALHAGELFNEPLGRDLIDHLGADEINARSFEGWSGLKLADIDHAILGLTLDEHALDHFILVVRTRRPIDQERVRKTLKAGSAEELPAPDGRTVYPSSMKLNLGPIHEVRVKLWFADEQTLVATKVYDAGANHRVPKTPETGIAHLRPELRQFIEQRIGPSAQFWIAGRLAADNWLVGLLSLPGFPLPLSREETSLLTQLRMVGVWVTVHPTEMILRGSFQCADEESAKAVYNYLAPSNRQGFKALLGSPEPGPLEKALNDSMKRTQDGTWVEFQARAPVEAVRQGK
jgi:hypothetical protein